MSRNEILRGTAILTGAGMLTRFMGFFYRIFLSRAFGEEGVGIYQLIFPVFAFCYAASTAGTETALSRTIAKRKAQNRPSECLSLFWIALTISVGISTALLLIVQTYAPEIAANILKEPRCERLLVILTYALPPAAIHGCACGYSYGKKHTRIPALSQLLEQAVRIASVFLLAAFAAKNEAEIPINYAVLGLVFGELAAAFYSFRFLGKQLEMQRARPPLASLRPLTGELLSLSLPLAGSRMLLCALQSLESISIPAKLQEYGHSAQDALSIYGVLTGMAMPCIFFPTAVTNAAAVMLLPTVAELQAKREKDTIRALIRQTVTLCVGLGCLFCVFFLLLGKWMGAAFFNSSLAAQFIRNLAFICPFLYTNGALISMINGLGKAGHTFFINVTGICVRIFFIRRFMGVCGITAYLYAILFSQIIVFSLSLLTIRRSRSR